MNRSSRRAKGRKTREKTDDVGVEGVAVLRLPFIGEGEIDVYWFLLNQDRQPGTARVFTPQLEFARKVAYVFAEKLNKEWAEAVLRLDTASILYFEAEINKVRVGQSLPRIEYALLAPRPFLSIALALWLGEGEAVTRNAESPIPLLGDVFVEVLVAELAIAHGQPAPPAEWMSMVGALLDVQRLVLNTALADPLPEMIRWGQFSRPELNAAPFAAEID